jgi:hypothetical protein
MIQIAQAVGLKLLGDHGKQQMPRQMRGRGR